MRSEFDIYDWIKVYIEAEDVLNAKIERCKMRITDLQGEETQLQTWLEAERANIQNLGSRETKAVWINLLDGELVVDNKRKSFQAPPYVKIQYGDNTVQSKAVDSLVHPRWNQPFKL
jgi:hypothetical protein